MGGKVGREGDCAVQPSYGPTEGYAGWWVGSGSGCAIGGDTARFRSCAIPNSGRDQRLVRHLHDDGT